PLHPRSPPRRRPGASSSSRPLAGPGSSGCSPPGTPPIQPRRDPRGCRRKTMMFRKTMWTLSLLALLAALPLAARQEKTQEKGGASQADKLAQPPLRTYHNRYEIRFLDLHSAEKLAWDLCGYRDSCRVTAQSTEGKAGGVLGVEADAQTHEKIARELARLDVAPSTQNFQLILLAG